MKTAIRAAVAAFTVALSCGTAFANDNPPTLQALLGNPDGLKVAGSTRVRYESVDGQARTGFEPSSQIVSLRTTLMVDYTKGPLRIGGELRDARVYNAGPLSPVTANEVNAFEPVQAYIGANLGDVLGSGTKTSFQAGRMTMTLGSGRLLSGLEFRNTTNGVTGLRTDFVGKTGGALTMFWLMPQLRLPADKTGLLDNKVQLDKESTASVLWGAYATSPKLMADTKFDVGYFRFAEHDRPSLQTRDRNLHTINLRLFRNPSPGKLDWEAEHAFQFGHISSSAVPGASTQKVAASFTHLAVGKTFGGSWAPHLSLEYDHASGSQPTGSYGRFDTLQGNAPLDFAPSGIYSEVNRANITSPGVRLEVTPSKRFDGLLEFRSLFVPSVTDGFASTNVRDPSGKARKYAGEQYDVRGRYWVIPKVLRAEVDLTYLRKGPFFADAPNAPPDGDTKYGAFSLIGYF
jgi:hypothetical protein